MRIAVLGLFFLAVPAFASPITFVFTGIDSGSVGGTGFVPATITVTAVADTAHIVAPATCFCANYSVVTDSVNVSISGVGTFALTTPTQMWWATDVGGLGSYSGNPNSPVFSAIR